MMNPKDYSDLFVIKKERDEYAIKDYVGHVEDTLVIPNGVTRISQYAFSKNKCLKIKKIIFPKTLKRIPDCNFEYWEHLEEIVIPEGIKSIADEAFIGTGIREVLLPSTIDKIGKGAFAYCDNLIKITMLHLTTPLLNSFMNNSYSSGYREPKLKFKLFFGQAEEIEFSDYFNRYYNSRDEKAKFSLHNYFVMYGNYVIGYVGQDKNITVPDDAIGIASEAFIFNKKIQSVVLGKKIKTIGCSAFEGCSSLHTVVLNEALDKIGDYAFADSGLKEITIPVKVSFVGEGAFVGCSKLQVITTVEKLIGDYYRISNWHTWWDKGFYGEKKREYLKNF